MAGDVRVSGDLTQTIGVAAATSERRETGAIGSLRSAWYHTFLQKWHK